MTPDWMRLADPSAVPSPALLVFPERIEENLRRMIALAGGPERLRPHLKTHKLPQLIALQARLGITRCKAATIAEAEMAAGAGATDITLSTQPVGPNAARLVALIRAFPSVAFSTIADDPGAVDVLARVAAEAGVVVEVLVDLDVGMARTGIAPGPGAAQLYRRIAAAPRSGRAACTRTTDTCASRCSPIAARPPPTASRGSMRLPRRSAPRACRCRAWCGEARRRFRSTPAAPGSNAAREPACCGTPATRGTFPTSNFSMPPCSSRA